jgi:steroid delta-isomerase-like uncharacterized protein
MTSRDNETPAHQWHLEMIQEGKLDLGERILTSDIVAHVNGQRFEGLEAAKGLAQALKTAFPDVHITHHDTLASGDKVAIRWSATGTHGGDYFGIPASNNTVSFEGIDWFRVSGGKISEMWIAFDNLGATQQMGTGTPP